jgi:hypothetical protein
MYCLFRAGNPDIVHELGNLMARCAVLALDKSTSNYDPSRHVLYSVSNIRTYAWFIFSSDTDTITFTSVEILEEDIH